MKKMFIPTLAMLTIAMLFSACDKTENEVAALNAGDEYFVFGSYFGHCLGEDCIQIYKLQNGKLYEDTLDAYPTAFMTTGYQGRYRELGAEAYAAARDLPAALPARLLSERDTILGMPDAGDWGGLYVETLDANGQKRWWFLDNMNDNIPAYLHPFADALRTAVQRIGEE